MAAEISSQKMCFYVANAGTSHYIHNADDQIIAELDAAGNTLREYIYMNDLPVAVIEAGTSLFWVHSDHLNRPVKMLDRNRNSVWEACYEPFGTVHSIVGTAANDNRFPGQLFQLETGLAYNWHRHYDSTIGRYTQPDPLGLTAMLSDGPSVYNYALQSPMIYTDQEGLMGRGSPAGKLPANCSCPPIPDHPPGSDVNKNMCLSKKKGALTPWFYNQVRNKGPWDYKQQGSQYQDFGNFNYGASGRAGGAPSGVLKRAAGWAQRQAGTSRPEWGTPLGEAPYGDDPADQKVIEDGMRYNDCRCGR